MNTFQNQPGQQQNIQTPMSHQISSFDIPVQQQVVTGFNSEDKNKSYLSNSNSKVSKPNLSAN